MSFFYTNELSLKFKATIILLISSKFNAKDPNGIFKNWVEKEKPHIRLESDEQGSLWDFVSFLIFFGRCEVPPLHSVIAH